MIDRKDRKGIYGAPDGTARDIQKAFASFASFAADPAWVTQNDTGPF
jgi:hypothetical protein